MSEYIVIHGKVEKCKSISTLTESIVSVTLKNGSVCSGLNKELVCDKNGKSLDTGEYHNYQDFERKNGICECCNRETSWNEVNGIFVNRIK